jgi:hypothetical protein
MTSSQRPPGDDSRKCSRQDHTTLPYAAHFRPARKMRLRLPRPSQPAPRSVTIARTSLMAARAKRTSASDLPDVASNNSDFQFTNS